MVIEPDTSIRDIIRAILASDVPDEKSGEAVKVYVVKKYPALTVAVVITHCRANLAGYKVPKHMQFRDTLSKSLIGILRHKLREEEM